MLNFYLSLEPLVKPAGDHASGVCLDGDDSPQPVPERLTHQEAPAVSLEASDSLTGYVIRCTQFPGTNQSLQASEAHSHLSRCREEKIFTVLNFSATVV